MRVCVCHLYRCFLELISEFRDHFCAQLDNAQTGIRATLRRLMQLLQHCDYELWNHIEVECKVSVDIYGVVRVYMGWPDAQCTHAQSHAHTHTHTHTGAHVDCCGHVNVASVV